MVAHPTSVACTISHCAVSTPVNRTVLAVGSGAVGPETRKTCGTVGNNSETSVTDLTVAVVWVALETVVDQTVGAGGLINSRTEGTV